MKNFLKVLVLSLVITLVFMGCGKRPAQEISDTEAAINGVIKEGADVYAKDELAKLQNDLTAAMSEVETQGKKLFKKYGTSKEMLAKVKADAEALAAAIPARKEQAKNDAISAQNEARTALEEAKTLLASAPKGKGTKADIEAFTADLKGLEDSLPEVQQLIDSENYFGASDKAKAIQEKAAGIAEQIKQAIEKVKKR